MHEKKNLSPPKPPKWKKKKKKTKKLSQTLRANNSQMRRTISLKFGIWGAEGGGHLHYENDLSSKREHRAMYENFKRRIGIVEKSHETRRDYWDGNVNHKSQLWL